MFSQQLCEQFEKRMVVHIRKKFPEKCSDVSDEKMLNFVKDNQEKAGNYGITSQNDIRCFLEYAMIYGADMDVNEVTSWIGNVLRRNDLTGSNKMSLLDELELEQVRGQI